MSGQPFAQRQGSPVLTDTAAGASVCVPGEDTEVPGRRLSCPCPRHMWKTPKAHTLQVWEEQRGSLSHSPQASCVALEPPQATWWPLCGP